MISKITHISILVHDQQEALKFYTDTLGLEVRTDAPMGEGQRWVTVGPKGQPDMEIILQPTQWGPGTQTPAERSQLVGKNQGFIFETDDIKKDYTALKKKGVKFSGEPQNYPWAIQVAFEDLYGNIHLLSQPAADYII